MTNITFLFIRLGLPPFQIISPHIFRGMARLEFTCTILQFYTLLHFFWEFSSKKLIKKSIKTLLILTGLISLSFIFFYIGWGIYTFYTKDIVISSHVKNIIYLTEIFYLLEGFIAIIFIGLNYREENIHILKNHIFTLGVYFVIPFWVAKIFESDFLAPTINFSTTSMIVNLPASTITSVLLTGMIYYCSKKLMGLRFLNITSHVQSKPSEKYNFIDDFKKVLGRLSTISSIEEVKRITQNFFHEAFKIPSYKVNLLIIKCKLCDEGTQCNCENDPKKVYIEKFLNNSDENKKVIEIIHSDKIMICDELELTHFYNQQTDDLKDDLNFVMKFFKDTKIDVFLPVFSERKLVAYILIDRKARINQFYTDVDRDEMLIYADYLGRVVYLLMNMDLKNILIEKHQLLQQLSYRDKALSLIKRNAMPFVSTNKTRCIGVLTYKNGKFVYCNEEAKQFLKINLNEDRGNEITKKLSAMGHDAMVFSTTKEAIIVNSHDEKLFVTASPNIIKDNAIITVSTPAAIDIIKEELKALSDYNRWDYLITLKTSEEGKLVSQLIPSDAQIFLNVKLSILEHALTKNMMFLNLASEDDALSFAHLAYKISGREIFEDICLKRFLKDESIEHKLFGINPFFNTTGELGALERLNGKGMLLISNVNYMGMEMQKKLLEFILSGKYTMVKSDEPRQSDIFLVFSTSQDLKDLVNKGLFLKELYTEMQKVTVNFPSLTSISENEFFSLVDGIREQVIQSKLYQKVLSFSEQDKVKLLSLGCVSLTELKSKIQGILHKRSKKQLNDEEVIDSANDTDAVLVEAARLGKAALKDPRLLYSLMQKFNNNQAKVASLLGVNRSTVSRKCTQYGIISMVPKLEVKKFQKNTQVDTHNSDIENEAS